MPVETEIKLQIDPGDLERVAAPLGEPKSSKSLRNTYLDTPAHSLRGQLVMLRLRHVKGREGAIVTVKGRAERRDGVFSAPEHEWKLSEEEQAAFAEDPQTQAHRLEPLLAGAALGDLRPVGFIEVWRRAFELDPDVTLELDHVRFSDGTEDAEIELEVPPELLDRARTMVSDLLSRTGVEAREQEQTKYERFLARINTPDS